MNTVTHRSTNTTGWYISSWGTALLVALPVLAVFYLALFPEENIWPHLAATVLPVYIKTTLLLMIGVGAGSVLIGVSCAWLVTMCQFPGKRFFEWALL